MVTAREAVVLGGASVASAAGAFAVLPPTAAAATASAAAAGAVATASYRSARRKIAQRRAAEERAARNLGLAARAEEGHRRYLLDEARESEMAGAITGLIDALYSAQDPDPTLVQEAVAELQRPDPVLSHLVTLRRKLLDGPPPDPEPEPEPHAEPAPDAPEPEVEDVSDPLVEFDTRMGHAMSAFTRNRVVEIHQWGQLEPVRRHVVPTSTEEWGALEPARDRVPAELPVDASGEDAIDRVLTDYLRKHDPDLRKQSAGQDRAGVSAGVLAPKARIARALLPAPDSTADGNPVWRLPVGAQPLPAAGHTMTMVGYDARLSPTPCLWMEAPTERPSKKKRKASPPAPRPVHRIEVPFEQLPDPAPESQVYGFDVWWLDEPFLPKAPEGHVARAMAGKVDELGRSLTLWAVRPLVRRADPLQDWEPAAVSRVGEELLRRPMRGAVRFPRW